MAEDLKMDKNFTKEKLEHYFLVLQRIENTLDSKTRQECFKTATYALRKNMDFVLPMLKRFEKMLDVSDIYDECRKLITPNLLKAFLSLKIDFTQAQIVDICAFKNGTSLIMNLKVTIEYAF